MHLSATDPTNFSSRVRLCLSLILVMIELRKHSLTICTSVMQFHLRPEKRACETSATPPCSRIASDVLPKSNVLPLFDSQVTTLSKNRYYTLPTLQTRKSTEHDSVATSLESTMPETFTGPHIVRFELCLRMFDCSRVPRTKMRHRT